MVLRGCARRAFEASCTGREQTDEGYGAPTSEFPAGEWMARGRV